MASDLATHNGHGTLSTPAGVINDLLGRHLEGGAG